MSCRPMLPWVLGQVSQLPTQMYSTEWWVRSLEGAANNNGNSWIHPCPNKQSNDDFFLFVLSTSPSIFASILRRPALKKLHSFIIRHTRHCIQQLDFDDQEEDVGLYCYSKSLQGWSCQLCSHFVMVWLHLCVVSQAWTLSGGPALFCSSVCNTPWFHGPCSHATASQSDIAKEVSLRELPLT